MTRHPSAILNGALLAAIASAASLVPASARACAACYGQSDSPMAAGMNWGIVTLLGIIVAVLGGIASCFILVARRSASVPRDSIEAALAAQAEASWPEVAGAPYTSDAQPLPERGGLKRVSPLAQQRRHCASVQTASPHLAVSRGRH